MSFMWANPLQGPTEGGVLKIETFLDPEMATSVCHLGQKSLDFLSFSGPTPTDGPRIGFACIKINQPFVPKNFEINSDIFCSNDTPSGT